MDVPTFTQIPLPACCPDQHPCLIPSLNSYFDSIAVNPISPAAPRIPKKETPLPERRFFRINALGGAFIAYQ